MRICSPQFYDGPIASPAPSEASAIAHGRACIRARGSGLKKTMSEEEKPSRKKHAGNYATAANGENER
jgi:hypothetical protein